MQSVLLLILFIRHPFCVCLSQWFLATRNAVHTDWINVIHISGLKKCQLDSKLLFFAWCLTLQVMRIDTNGFSTSKLIYSTSIAAINGSHASLLVFAFFIRETLADSTTLHKVFTFYWAYECPKSSPFKRSEFQTNDRRICLCLVNNVYAFTLIRLWNDDWEWYLFVIAINFKMENRWFFSLLPKYCRKKCNKYNLFSFVPPFWYAPIDGTI